MSQRHHRRPRHRLGKKQGFSRPVARQWFEILGIQRHQKREFFNLMSKSVVYSFALTAGLFGLVQVGVVAGLVSAGLGAWFGTWFVKKDRMLR